ncbi:uncharacterized protein LOC106664278 isoform X2 [Cimex lectularius]|uniref:Uncharacterized protein n=1 Tax=Cimex lectularius TaxID=79782 RepID=A0A8I6ST61_CIMLE|nr:uncharacterized protein LOC106664278 isoform X2 [Cimex lectularius]
MWPRVVRWGLGVATATVCAFSAYKAFQEIKRLSSDLPEFYLRQDLERRRDTRRFANSRQEREDTFLADASTDEDEDAQRAGTTRRVIYHRTANIEDSPNILEGIYPRPEVDRYRPSRAERSPILTAILEQQRSSTVQEENNDQEASLSTDIETPARNEDNAEMPNTENQPSLSTDIDNPARNEDNFEMPITENRLRSTNMNETEESEEHSSEISDTNLRNRKAKN